MTDEIALGSGRIARCFVLKDVVFCYCFELSERCGYRLGEYLLVIFQWVVRVCEIKKSGEGRHHLTTPLKTSCTFLLLLHWLLSLSFVFIKVKSMNVLNFRKYPPKLKV